MDNKENKIQDEKEIESIHNEETKELVMKADVETKEEPSDVNHTENEETIEMSKEALMEEATNEAINPPADDMQSTPYVETSSPAADRKEVYIETKESASSSHGEPAPAPIKSKKGKKKHDESFFKRHQSACLLTGCLLLSTGGGFSGVAVYHMMNQSDDTPIIYQSTNSPIQTSSKTGTSSVKEIAEHTMPSVVQIQTESVSTAQFMQQYVETGAGSGVILSKDGYIVTNNHVIEGASKIQVTTHDGKTYTATLIGKDSQSDLALLKIDADNLTPAVLGESSKLSIGDSAIAIGNPLGQGATLTTGVISALDKELTIDGETMKLLQTNAAINPGNSGGGLFNSNGELIGIVNAKTSGESIEGLGFAIPIDEAKTVIEELMKNGYVSNRAYIGVSLVDIDNEMSAMQAGVNDIGVYISRVVEGEAADKAGLKSKDQIIEVDGEEVSTAAEVKSAIHQKSAGDTMTLKIKRDGKTSEVKVTLGETPRDEDTTSSNRNSNNYGK